MGYPRLNPKQVRSILTDFRGTGVSHRIKSVFDQAPDNRTGALSFIRGLKLTGKTTFGFILNSVFVVSIVCRSFLNWVRHHHRSEMTGLVTYHSYLH